MEEIELSYIHREQPRQNNFCLHTKTKIILLVNFFSFEELSVLFRVVNLQRKKSIAIAELEVPSFRRKWNLLYVSYLFD